MTIKKCSGTITHIKDLSKTAKEVSITLSEPLAIVAGSFVNIFMTIDDQKIRRAYSISSDPKEQDHITISMRLSPNGIMTPLFWNSDMTNQKIEVMGPMGLNTADKMLHDHIYLFGFGIGAGVVKSLARHFCDTSHTKKVTIITGSRTDDEILYKEYFDSLAKVYPMVDVSYAVSQGSENSIFKKGYIQEHLQNTDFNHADVYVCGQEAACNELVATIKNSQPIDCEFFIEGFH
jgi:NAD(P)H-flavin reductase